MIGLGIMGSAMSANLVEGGFKVVGDDVLPACRKRLQKAGGAAVSTSRDVGKRSPIIVTSLPSSQALLDTAAELVRSARSGQIVIETSTLPIAVKEEARRQLELHGVTMLDCPTPLFAASAPIYTAALATRDGSEDMAAVCAVLEEMANSPHVRRGRQRKAR